MNANTQDHRRKTKWLIRVKCLRVCSAECTLVEEIEINEDESTFLLTNHLHIIWIIEFAAQIIQDVINLDASNKKYFLYLIVITSVDT